MSERSYHHGDLKRSLLDAAKTLLTDKSIDSLSLREIAKHVGVSHMAPYAHFKNKSQLLQTLAADGFNELGERMLSVKYTQPDPRQLILLYGVQYIEYAVANPQIYRLMLSQTNPGEHLSSAKKINALTELQQASQAPYRLLRDGFAHFENNEQKVSVQAQGAWAMVHGIASLMIEGHIRLENGMGYQEFLSIAALQK